MPADAPVKIIVGVDGSTGAEAAVKVVAQRPWPAQTEVLLLSAVPSISAATSSLMVMPVSQWFVEERARVEAAAGKLEKELRTTGLKVRAMILEGDPKSVLLDEAEKWGADCIFVGAAGMSAIDRLLLGSISAAVATRAECSVEVVRSEKA
ncbi:MAG: universal stress protein [Acidobacteria bacterium]|nr:universal stress protein [Acidobacteriota bacterium]